MLNFARCLPLLLVLTLVGCADSDPLPVEPATIAAPGDPALSSFSKSGPPTETTFSATLDDFNLVNQTVLPNGTVIAEFTNLWQVTGDWIGTLSGDFTFPNRSMTHTNGVGIDRAIFTFEGNVLGLEGTLELRFLGHFKADGTFIGRSTILRGTGELASLRGHGTNVVSGPGEIQGTFFVL